VNGHSTPATKKGFGGCLLAVLSVFGLIGILLILNALTPYSRQPRTVTVTILDEAQQPVPNAIIDFQEYEWVFFIPPLTFASPSRFMERRRTVTTDSHGKAQFTVKLENADANRVSRTGQPLKVVSCQTNDTFRGSGQRFSSGGLPQWGAIAGVGKVSYESTIVVATQQRNETSEAPNRGPSSEQLRVSQLLLSAEPATQQPRRAQQ
jgi:hypothetical protein